MTIVREKLIKEELTLDHMADVVVVHDFIEVDYTGTLADGTIFDTTLERVAHTIPGHNHGAVFKAAVVCVGEKQLLPGLDEAFVGKEVGKEYTVHLSTEKAFGKRDIKKVRLIPMSTFKEHKVAPQVGLSLDVDGERGVVSRVAGGRVLVNFNHPLAGVDVVYTFTIKRKIVEPSEQIVSFLSAMMQLKKDAFKVSVADGKASVDVPFTLPAPFLSALSEKLCTLTKLSEVSFVTKEEKQQ